jgi:hypothetical protein
MALAWAGIGFFAGILLMHCLVAALRSDIIPDDQRWTHARNAVTAPGDTRRAPPCRIEWGQWEARLPAIAVRTGQAPKVYRCPSPKPFSREPFRTELRGAFSMYTTRDGQSALTAQIDRGCLSLFELWCERRSVIELAYLMHGWPMSTPAPSRVARLSSSLRELMSSYPESFDVEDRHMVADVVLICERVLEYSAPEPQSASAGCLGTLRGEVPA